MPETRSSGTCCIWVCTRSSPPFSKLVFVPLLTPPGKGNEGRIPQERFPCRDFIRPFLASLRIEPRTLERISGLGTAEPTRSFQVSVFAPERFLRAGVERPEYWMDFDASKHEYSVVFFDPDIGFETKKQDGQKWISHDELTDVFARLPQNSAVVVYQHWPHRAWETVFTELERRIDYAHMAAVAYEPNLAFVAIAGNHATAQRAAAAIKKYAEEHRTVEYRAFRLPTCVSHGGVVSATRKSMSKTTTQVGDVNTKGQVLVQKTKEPSPNHPFAKVWNLRCPTHGRYRANSCDFHIRRCPHEGGEPELQT